VRKVVAAHEILVIEVQEMSVKERRSLITRRHLKSQARNMVEIRLCLDHQYNGFA